MHVVTKLEGRKCAGGIRPFGWLFNQPNMYTKIYMKTVSNFKIVLFAIWKPVWLPFWVSLSTLDQKRGQFFANIIKKVDFRGKSKHQNVFWKVVTVAFFCSFLFTFVCLLLAAPDGPPLEVVAIAISENRIFVSWEDPDRQLQNGVILEYIIRYTKVEDASSNSAELETISKGNRVVITNLSPGVTYRVRVAAKNSAGLSPWSPKLTVRTFKSSELIKKLLLV